MSAALLVGFPSGSALRNGGPVESGPASSVESAPADAPLYLMPTFVPEGLDLLRAHGGNDPGRETTKGGSPEIDEIQTWVRFDQSGERPLGAFTLQRGAGLTADPLAPYSHDADRVTVRGHRGYYSADGGGRLLSWEEPPGQVVTLAALRGTPVGSFDMSLSRARLFAVAANLKRKTDGSFSVREAPRGFVFVARQPGFASSGTNQRVLFYTDSQNRGFKVELVDHTQVPPGSNLSVPGARRITIRGHEAVLTSHPYSPPGGGCWAGDGDFLLCNSDATYLIWMASSTTRAAIIAVGITEKDIITTARSMTVIDENRWQELARTHPSLFPT